MIFYEKETAIAITICYTFFIASLVFQFKIKKQSTALVVLLFAAACSRLLFTRLDSYLADWDERFHALVGKHMMNFPLKPMLRLNPILPYDVEAWCCNHIWVHKQPLFLWQMGLSMKLFGVNEVAMRLPSAIMGTIMVFFVYEIAKRWTKNQDIGFIAAFLFASNIKFLEIITGNAALDHNDMTFSFYVTASIWAFTKYCNLRNYKWALIVGIFVGCAILNKWLTGLLIYAGWGIMLLFDSKNRTALKNYFHLGSSFLIACAVFIPWQIYILTAFPKEANASFKHNLEHIANDLGHSGTVWYHLNYAMEMYNIVGVALVILGFFWVFNNTSFSKQISIAMTSILFILYTFFSVIVKTKMPGFCYPVAVVVFSLMSIGLYYAIFFVQTTEKKKSTAFILFVSLLGLLQLSPSDIVNNRKHSDFRDKKIHNTNIFKQLDEKKLNEYYIFNAKSYEDTEIMFYKNLNIHQWYPADGKILDSLSHLGYKIAMFDSPVQPAPAYSKNNANIVLIPIDFK